MKTKYRVIQTGKNNPSYHIEELNYFLWIFPCWDKITYVSDYGAFGAEYSVKRFESYYDAKEFIKNLIDQKYKEIIPINHDK